MKKVKMADSEYLMKLRRRFFSDRVPVTGSIELTKRCNLRCVHCYNGEQDESRGMQGMETARVLSLIDEITEAGCLFLLITGGEPLLRRDFPEIYRHAKRNGLLVTVYTNGTLISDSILDLFVELPPKDVEISLYGATEATYEKVTGVKGSYKRCMIGIKKLVDRKVHLKLKTVLMTYNLHEIYDIKRMAEEYGANFRFDPAIFPRFSGDKAPMELRVPPEEAVRIEFSRPEWAKLLKEYYEKYKGAGKSDALYSCGAGQTAFHVDSEGSLRPCLMNDTLKHDLAEGGFMSGWQGTMQRLRERKALDESVCSGCEKRLLCGYCPSFNLLESGSEHAFSRYTCAMGEQRYREILKG
jgi:radical SAM protein with 4Fe4S-binding SPASM domain